MRLRRDLERSFDCKGQIAIAASTLRDWPCRSPSGLSQEMTESSNGDLQESRSLFGQFEGMKGIRLTC